MTSLYICYFGLRQPLVQTQVLPYLRGLARGGVKIILLTFEPEPRRQWDARAVADWRERLRAEGIEWLMQTYHRRPTLPATLFDIVAGALRIARLVRKHRVDILHARSHVAAMMGALARKLTGAKLIFDIRGLLADEYADAGHWSRSGLPYRATKAGERYLLRSADGHVVLTERAREELLPDARNVELIPCCFDPRRFANVVKVSLGEDRVVVAYAGSLGGAYLTRELAELFAAARSVDPRVFPLVLTQSAPDAIRAELARVGFTDFHVGYADPDELPRYLAAADIGVSMLQPTYSKIAMSPTKVAEYLAAGLVVITPRGIGDLDAQVDGERVGVLLDGLDAAAFADAFARAQALRGEAGFRERAREVARRLFDLDSVGVARYRRLYDKVRA